MGIILHKHLETDACTPKNSDMKNTVLIPGHMRIDRTSNKSCL